jgi:hypothetical protein
MGADQCGVPGCDWRSNTNTYCHGHGDDNTDRHTETNAIAKTHPVPKGSSNSSAAALADSAAKTLIRYRGNRQGATKVSSEASTSFAIDRYAKKSLNRFSCTMEA